MKALLVLIVLMVSACGALDKRQDPSWQEDAKKRGLVTWNDYQNQAEAIAPGFQEQEKDWDSRHLSDSEIEVFIIGIAK